MQPAPRCCFPQRKLGQQPRPPHRLDGKKERTKLMNEIIPQVIVAPLWTIDIIGRELDVPLERLDDGFELHRDS